MLQEQIQQTSDTIGRDSQITSLIVCTFRGDNNDRPEGRSNIAQEGTYRDGSILNIAGPFQVLRSFSEGLEEQYGFWLDTTSPLFAYAGPPLPIQDSNSTLMMREDM